MRVIFMGTPEFSVPVLDALVNAGHDICAVYSQPPRPAGRGKKDRPSPVHARAAELGLPVRHPLNFQAARDVQEFAELQADVAVVVAYGLILPQTLLDAPRNGCLNIHASLLPRWRGAAPIHRAIMAGDRETGICIMQMESGLDTGPVLMRQTTPIAGGDTTGGLHDRLSHMGADMICDALAKLRQLSPTPQGADGVTYATKIDKAEARIDWTQPAALVDQRIRGLSPFPGAWFRMGDSRVKVLNSALTQGAGPAGTVLQGTTVACGDGAVTLTSLQPAGKKPMTADAFMQGRKLPDFLE